MGSVEESCEKVTNQLKSQVNLWPSEEACEKVSSQVKGQRKIHVEK